jgi:UPF0755 protein
MKRITLSLLFIAILAGGGGIALHSYRASPLTMTADSLRFKVDKGAKLDSVVTSMQSSGLQVQRWRLALALKLRGDSRAIKAGVYQIDRPTTLEQLLDKMVRGDVVIAELLIVEGWTFQQLRAKIDAHAELLHDSAALSEMQLLERLGARETHPEGLFFPSTYRFSPGSSDLDVYRQAYRLMQQTLAAAWEKRRDGLPLRSPYEALVLASIVEKETGRAEDRDKVAAVFVNRLRIGMPLQSDPTTIYGMGQRFDGNLRKRDLQTDTPYNTYTRHGLPPTPIGAPGRAAIEAVMHPAQIKALYFVARGDGSSEFSNDLEAHNRAVARFQLNRKP